MTARETAATSTTEGNDFAKMSRNAFDASKTYFDTAVRNQIDADLRQFYGLHAAGSKYHSDAFKARSKIFRPKTRMAIRKNEAVAAEALFSTTDVISITAVDPDDPMQRAAAALHKELLQHRLTKTIPWFTTTIGAYQDAQAVGICASYQYWRYEKKGRRQIDQPCVDLIPPENIRFDPSADWRDVVNTSPYLIHLMPMYVKDVRARMKAASDPKTGQARWKLADDNVIKGAMVPNSDSTRQLREDKRPDSAGVDRGITDFDVVFVYRIFMEVDGEDMVWYCLANNFHMLTEPKLIDELYFHGKRPYQIGFCVIETHKTHPSGVARLTHQQQAEINEVANTRLDNVKLAMNKRWLAKRGKQVDIRSLTRNIPNSVTLVTDMEDVEQLEFNDVTASSFQEQDRLNLDFDDMAGNFSQSSIQSNRNLNETVGGMKIMDANVGQMTGYQLRTWIETWLEPVLRQLVLLEAYYEDDQVLLALAGKQQDVVAYLEAVASNAITDEMMMQELTVNVNVGMSATNPQQQVERFVFGLNSLKEVLADGILQSAGADVREITREVMGKLGYRDGKRFFPDPEGEDPAVAALKQENAALQAELAAKRPPPELTAAQVAKLGVEAAKIEAETAEIEQRVLMAAQDPEADIAEEVDAQIADVTKRADAERQKSEQTIAEMRQKAASRETETKAKVDTTKYTVDKKAETDLAKEKLKADSAKELADMEAAVEKKLAPLQKRLEALQEQVKKVRETKAKKKKAPF